MAKSKKGLLVVIIIIVIAALCGAGYYFLVLKKPAEGEPVVWDGVYQMAGELTCEGNIPNLTTIPMTTNVTVSSNKVIEQLGGVSKSFDIDEDGKATEIIEPITANGVTTSGNVNYQFYQEGGVKKFTASGSMDISTTQGGVTYSSTCSGTVTGIKQ